MTHLVQSAGTDKHRVDIQALRGLAVLLVVVYHARLGAPASGYLGVDIFFVISGFLITSLVKSTIERGEFSFSEFYFRRAKRLLPAAYTTFLLTGLIAPFILSTNELRDFVGQVIGAVTFTANIVLWQQAGYFEGPAELKPLLHVWSLAIEEQYYFILPATLALIPQRLWLKTGIAIVAVSLTLCIAGGFWKPIATFYLLPTRAWELAIGSIGAFVAHDTSCRRLAEKLFWPAALTLLTVPFVAISGNHPGIGAVSVCAATLILIIDGRFARSGSQPIVVLSRVGDISYSLYLVHWPIFAFISNAWAGEHPGKFPWHISIVAIALSLALANLMYRFIEDPIRRSRMAFSWTQVGRLGAASLLLVTLPVGFSRAFATSYDFETIRRVNYGLHSDCDQKDGFTPRPECQNSPSPSIMLWGDSYAMHLISALQTNPSASLIQATRSACGPQIGAAIKERTFARGYNEAWAKSCIQFNDEVLNFLKASPGIETVVLSSPFRAVVDPTTYSLLLRDQGNYIEAQPSIDLAVRQLRKTIESIRALNKKVVLVAPPPSSTFNIGACLERRMEKKLVLGASANCEIVESEYRKVRTDMLTFMSIIERDADIHVIRFDPLLCADDICKTSLDGVPLYRDSGHLSYDGSRLLGQRMSLLDQVRQHAR